MVTLGQTRVAPRHINLVPKTTVLGVRFFLMSKFNMSEVLACIHLNGSFLLYIYAP